MAGFQGLDILYQLLQNVSRHETAAQTFYQTYYMEILQHVFSVVTDTSHAAALTMHATILAYMFTIVEIGKVCSLFFMQLARSRMLNLRRFQCTFFLFS